MNSYQKLKLENKELREDVYKILILKDMDTIMKYDIKFGLESALFNGYYGGGSLGEGIVPQIVRPYRIDLITKQPK
jgi:hypothetical protein